MVISFPIVLIIASFIAWAWGQGKPMGLPLEMQEAIAITSAPRSTNVLAREAAFLPGQPPQETNPTTSDSPISANANLPDNATLKSVVPGHISSVC